MRLRCSPRAFKTGDGSALHYTQDFFRLRAAAPAPGRVGRPHRRSRPRHPSPPPQAPPSSRPRVVESALVVRMSASSRKHPPSASSAARFTGPEPGLGPAAPTTRAPPAPRRRPPLAGARGRGRCVCVCVCVCGVCVWGRSDRAGQTGHICFKASPRHVHGRGPR